MHVWNECSLKLTLPACFHVRLISRFSHTWLFAQQQAQHANSLQCDNNNLWILPWQTKVFWTWWLTTVINVEGTTHSWVMLPAAVGASATSLAAWCASFLHWVWWCVMGHMQSLCQMWILPPMVLATIYCTYFSYPMPSTASTVKQGGCLGTALLVFPIYGMSFGNCSSLPCRDLTGTSCLVKQMVLTTLSQETHDPVHDSWVHVFFLVNKRHCWNKILKHSMTTSLGWTALHTGCGPLMMTLSVCGKFSWWDKSHAVCADYTFQTWWTSCTANLYCNKMANVFCT